MTSELFWNITKYYIVNPDCEFDGSLTYTRTDSLNDGDNDLDTIKATIPIKSILPNDKVRVKAVLRNLLNLSVAWTTEDYIVSNITSYHTINVTLPPGKFPGYYKLILYLYNSTGKINVIIWPLTKNNPNDTDNSDYLYLYPRGNQAPTTPSQPNGPISLQLGELGGWDSTTSDPNGDLVGQKWYMYYDTWPYSPQYDTGLYDPESLTPLVSHRYWTTGTHQIRLKAYDEYSSLLHPYESDLSPILNVEVTPWSGISDQQQTHQEGVTHIVEEVEQSFNGNQYGGQSVQWGWNFGDQSNCSTEQNPAHTYMNTGIYNITFNATDNETNLTGTTYMHVRISDLDSNFNMNYFHGAAPNTAISFRNTSKAKSGNRITNITWNFSDGTISYDSNVNHTFEEDGDYNVTLTVKDNENNTDVDYAILHITSDPEPPEIPYVQSPGVIHNASDATILSEVVATDRNLSTVKVNITAPDNTSGNYTMTNLVEDIYIFTLNTSLQNGQYNFTVWATDSENNTNSTSGYYVITLPFLYYEPLTPASNTYVNHPWVPVNVTIVDPFNTSAFIDWNHSLKGYWPMDSYNATCIYDNSSYQNYGWFDHGINTSNITTGKYGKGLEFDGNDDYVNLGNDTSLNLSNGNFTFIVWEKSHATSSANITVILSNQPENENGTGYVFGVKNAPFFSTMETGQSTSLNGSHDVTDNAWHHLAYVRKGNNLSLYVDGMFDAGTTGTLRNITNNQSTCFSYENRTDWYHFDGMLDEAQLFGRALSREEVNASYNNGLYRLVHNFTGLADGSYQYYAHAIDAMGDQSTTETHYVTVDTVAPTITLVNASPGIVGLGFNVTIDTNVSDERSGVKNISVNISYPAGSGNNPETFTMGPVSGSMYRYVFSDTWYAGCYNYTIIVYDNASNVKNSIGYSFNVSANAIISISTLNDTYAASQYINITDPPDPPENLTLVGRGFDWDKYYDAVTGQNILEVFAGPVNYQNETNEWMPINNTISPLASNHPAYVHGYRNGNDHGLYGVYFKPNAQNDWPVAFTYNRSDDPTTHVIRSKLVGVGYIDPASNWAYQYLQNVQSSQGQITGNAVTYEDVFTGTDVTWSYGNTGLKEEITLSNATKTVLQNHPPSMYGLNNQSSYLVFITKLDHQNLNLCNISGLLTGNVTISDSGVDFRDTLGQFKCALPLDDAYELNNESVREKLTYRIVHLNGNTYLLSGLKISDLNTMTFPVVIDPTLTVYTSTSDGYLSASDSEYNTVWSAKEGTVSDTDTDIAIGQTGTTSEPENYSIYRGFLFFNTSSLPSNAIIDNATLALCKKDDFSTTDFAITVQNGQPTYPHDPLESGDYAKENYYSEESDSLATADFKDGINEIMLTNLNWINRSSMTKLCLRSSRDINGTQPTGDEYVTIYSADTTQEPQNYVPRLIITYRNQSKIKNTGSTDIKGYLLIQIQYYNTSKSEWLLDNDTINENSPRTIDSGNQLALDTIFNGKIRASDLTHGEGLYRVYTTFRDPEGNMLKTGSEAELEAWWQFSKT